jgi:hypothetical protein
MKLLDYSIGGSPHETQGLNFPRTSYLKLLSVGPLQAQGRYLILSFEKLLGRLTENLTPGRYKPTSLLKLHECPDLNQTCPKDRDFPSGAYYIDIKIPAVKGTYGYKRSNSLCSK